MFIRRMGRRLLVLESYRDGQGKVCQRRWGDFVDVAGLAKVCEALQGRLSGEQLSKLRERGETLLVELLGSEGGKERHQKASDLAKRLRHALDAGLEPEGEELRALRQRLEAGSANRVSPRRTRMEEHEAPDYVEALEQQIREQGPSVALLEKRVRLGDKLEHQLQLGSLLQASGQLQRARDVYLRISKRVPARHYQLASLAWAERDYRDALEHLCRGFVEDLDFEQTRHGRGLYWEQFGKHWSKLGRAFFMEVGGSMLVRFNLARSREKGVRVRRLLPTVSDRWFLPKVLKKLNLEEVGSSC